MPPRAVWKTRPSDVVPYRLMWARSSRTRSGGMGGGLIEAPGVGVQSAVDDVG